MTKPNNFAFLLFFFTHSLYIFYFLLLFSFQGLQSRGQRCNNLQAGAASEAEGVSLKQPVKTRRCVVTLVSTFNCLFLIRVGMKTQPESKCPELLANYCDMLLRKTPLSKKLTSEEIELKLKEVVSGFPDPFTCFLPAASFVISPPSLQLLVLKYVQNKDVFMRYHKAHLTRRLILDISADSEIEENMVEWLRVSLTHRQIQK